MHEPQNDFRPALPLRPAGEVALPGDDSRFDYESLDAARGLLFIAHLGANEVVEVDVHAGRVVRVIPDIAQVHGVLVVPELNRVYATATGVDQVIAIDEDSGAILGRAGTGRYPDGLAYDSQRNNVWTTNESAGTETVLDAATLQPRGTVGLGGEVGNVVYDQRTDLILVAVQGNNDVAVINPATLALGRRVKLPACQHPHGLTVDESDQLAFIACDGNATLVTLDQASWTPLVTHPLGDAPDVLAYDDVGHRLYVAAESGTLTTLDIHGHSVTLSGMGHLAYGAHVVAVDTTTHRTYYPIPNGTNGKATLLEFKPA